MLKPCSLLIVAIMSCATSGWSLEKASDKTSTIGIGYDEGVLIRAYILENVAGYIGVNYYVIGPEDSVGHQPLNRLAWKVGGEYVIKRFEKLRVNTFGEWRQEMIQNETSVSASGSTIRYNQWNTLLRVGLRPEYFLIPQLSIDYKIGIQFVHHGSEFSLNAAKDGVQSEKNEYDEAGLYCGRSMYKDTPEILLNLNVTLYIF